MEQASIVILCTISNNIIPKSQKIKQTIKKQDRLWLAFLTIDSII